MSLVEKEQLGKILDKLLSRGIIRESESPYASPIVLVRKKNSEYRLCVDYRFLNKITLRDNYPLPLIEDQIDKLRDKIFFTLLDLKDGFHHIDVSESSIPLTAFITVFGQFEWLKAPFGLKTMPAKFQRFINTIFSELIKAGEVIIYLDDILVASKTLEHHFEILKRVFNLMVENKLELRLDKCKFLQTKIDYLGYKISENGVSPTNHGIEAVLNFPIPQNPVFYFSKRTTEVESRYHSFELETLAIIYALRRFRIYLQGIPFKIVTDCNALKLTLDKKDINPRISRWALELEAYDKTFEHRAGEKMRHVDAFSRAVNVLIVEDNTFESNLSICQNLDPKIRELREKLQNSEDRLFEMRNGLIYRKRDNDILFYVPENMECHVLRKYHDEMGHFAPEKTINSILTNYCFPRMRDKVKT